MVTYISVLESGSEPYVYIRSTIISLLSITSRLQSFATKVGLLLLLSGAVNSHCGHLPVK